MRDAVRFRRYLLGRLLAASGLSIAALASLGGCNSGVECFDWSAQSCPDRLQAIGYFDLDCGERIESVDSDGSLDGGECCYEVTIEDYDACCNPFETCAVEGRPLRIDGAARLASAERVGGWSDGAAPCLDGLDAAERAALAASWTRAALDEHASIASFARFALELMVHGAPRELVALAHEAALDEVRHAAAAFALASAYAGAPMGPGGLELPAALPIERDLAAFAVATAVDACINETLAVLVASEAHLYATDSEVRAVLAAVVRDEARHAELAWRTLRWALDRGGERVRREVAAAVAGFDLLARLERQDGVAVPAHGLLDGRARRLALARGWREVVSPCLARLLGAGEQAAASC
jgi:hypothetical protein